MTEEDEPTVVEAPGETEPAEETDNGDEGKESLPREDTDPTDTDDNATPVEQTGDEAAEAEDESVASDDVGEADDDLATESTNENENENDGTGEGEGEDEGDAASATADTATARLSDLPLVSVVEAVLFAARGGLKIGRIAQCVGKGTKQQDVRDAIATLNESYGESGRAFEIVEIDNAYLMMSRPEYVPHLNVLFGREATAAAREKKLTGAQLDTLSIIAYRQPVTRVEVETVRGVGCGPVLRSLIERGQVRVVGRQMEVMGHPLMYGTTRKFLVDFGLGSLDQLPMVHQLRKQIGVEEDLPAPESEEDESAEVEEVAEEMATNSDAAEGSSEVDRDESEEVDESCENSCSQEESAAAEIDDATGEDDDEDEDDEDEDDEDDDDDEETEADGESETEDADE